MEKEVNDLHAHVTRLPSRWLRRSFKSDIEDGRNDHPVVVIKLIVIDDVLSSSSDKASAMGWPFEVLQSK